MSDPTKNTTTAPKKAKDPNAPKRMLLNATDKQYIIAGLKAVRADAEKAEANMFFDPAKVTARIDQLIDNFSK